jgi:uncharacterized protein (TIGR03643 family)
MSKVDLIEEDLWDHYSGLPNPSWYQYKKEVNSGLIKKYEPADLTSEQIDRIIEMAWEDRTPFDAIKAQFGLSEDEVKALMKKELKFSSYKLWRDRVENCKTKHLAKRNNEIDRFKSTSQRQITNNKISKR